MIKYNIVPDDGDGPSGTSPGAGYAVMAFALICTGVVGFLKLFGVL